MSDFYSLLLQEPAGGGMANIIFLVLIGVVFYFFMMRPQMKKQKSQASFSESLSKGSQVVTTGGLFGKVVSLDSESVVLEIDRGVKMKFLRSSISLENTKAAFPESVDDGNRKAMPKETKEKAVS